MPIEYLREISRLQLPLTVRDEANIDKLRILRAADLVLVMFPDQIENIQSATLLEITQKGKEVLALNLEQLP